MLVATEVVLLGIIIVLLNAYYINDTKVCDT